MADPKKIQDDGFEVLVEAFWIVLGLVILYFLATFFQ